MKKLFVFLGIVMMTVGSAVRAQEVDSMAPLQKSSWGDANDIVDYIPDISLDARFGYSQDITEKTGRFGGNGLFLDINGKISPHFSYSLNHRLANFEGADEPGFGNTNWLTLTYENDHIFVTAGKEDIKVGSYEYDAYDLDCYWEMNSLFWNYVNPWQWGVSAGWYPAEGHTLIAQVCNSPFSSTEVFNRFAYALAWRGEWEWYEPYWSVNMWEYQKGMFVKSLNLGNRFYVGDFTLDLDYTTRCKNLETAFTRDFSLMFSPAYEWDWGRAFVKAGWEKASESTYICLPEDLEDAPFYGDNIFYGAGVEFFPLKEYKDLRIHAVWGSNSTYTDGHILELGLTWKLNLTDAGKRIFKKYQKQ